MSWKRLLILSVITCLTIVSVIIPASAFSESSNSRSPDIETTIAPMSLYISRTTTTLSISSSGQATVVGSITGYSGITDKVYIFLYLEKYTNGSWTTETSWFQSFNSYHGTLQGTTYVAAGYLYRVRASYYAYSGSNSENLVGYSNTVYY